MVNSRNWCAIPKYNMKGSGLRHNTDRTYTMEYGYADNTTYATRNMVMQKTHISREHGIRLCRKTQFKEHMGWIHNATLVHRNFKARVISPVKMQSLSYRI